MPVTDLLDRIPIPTSTERDDAPTGSGDGMEAPGAHVPFSIEVPVVERVGIELPPSASAGSEAPDDGVAGTEHAGADAAASDLADALPVRSGTPRAPLPSWAVLVIGALALLCFALAVALASALTTPSAPEPTVADAATPEATAPSPETPLAASAAEPPSPATFPAEPAPIPVDLITRLEEAGDEDLGIELSRLLDAVQHGFGRRSARLEPTLQSYVYRMSSRFDWNPDTFRVAVTAPDADLAAARGALLEQLFADAVAAGRLEVGVGIGPHALTLVTE